MLNKFFLSIKEIRRHPWVCAISLITGCCLALLIYFYHWQLPLFSKSRLAFAGLAAIISSLGIAFFLSFKTVPLFRSYSRSKQILVEAMLGCAVILSFFLLSYPIPHLYPFYPNHSLEIKIDMVDTPQELQGIAFSHLKLAFRDVSFSELEIDGKYEIREGSIFFPSGQTARIYWQGITGEKAALSFLPVGIPVDARVSWDGKEQVLALQSGSDYAPTLSSDFPIFPYESLIIESAVTILIALAAFVLFTGMLGLYPYCSILLAVWLLVYLLYYPGIIGTVNIIAVDELLQGHPSDWHPLAYTLLTAFSIRFLASASSILLMQIAALALVYGKAFIFLQRNGVPRTLLLLFTWLIALWPANILSVITLTNDIPYSIALLALTYFAVRIVLTKGEWLRNSVNLFLLALCASIAVLFRYNGIPAVALFLICVFICYPKYWLRTSLVIMFVISAWFTTSEPLSKALNVTQETEGQVDNILLHHISAHVAAGTTLTVEESTYLDSLLPLEEWKYSCCTNTAMWLNSNFDRDAFHANSDYNRQLELSLFSRNPSLEFRHMLCASDLIWNPVDGCEIQHPQLEFLKGKYFWTGSYFPQYQENSFLPTLIEPVSAFINSLDSIPLLSILFWRPAWFLYLSLVCAIILCLRFRNPRWLLSIAPIFGQSAFLLLFNRVQNFRYQYCAVLAGFLLLCVAFYKPPIKE